MAFESINRYKVKLVATSNSNERIRFDITPNISESRSVNYEQLTPIHMPGTIMIYTGTPSRSFRLDVKLMSRTSNEASTRMQELQLMRGWAMPRFGIGSTTLTGDQPANRRATDEERRQGKISDITKTNLAQPGFLGVEKLGAPPEVLYFSAYSNSADTSTDVLTNIKKIPVVITSLSIVYPNEITYIPTLTGEPFPTFMDVGIDLMETHSPGEFSRFKLEDFKAGKLPGF